MRLIPTVDRGMRTGSWLVMSVVGLILLIACANVGNMLLARGVARRREMATRLSLGAGRARILRQLLIEGLLLAGLGGAAGLLLAVLSNRLLNRLELPAAVPLGLELGLDSRVVLFTLALAGLTAVVFALAPALESARADLTASMKEGGRGGRRGGQRLQASLVLVQVSLSLVLLVCAGLSMRSMLNASRVDPGFDPRGVVTAAVDPALQGWDRERWGEFYQRLREDLASVPGVSGVGYASHLPLSLAVNTSTVFTERHLDLPSEERPEIDVAWVSPGYFESMGIRLLQGRPFGEGDRPDGPRVAVVNETLARSFWPEQGALGRTVTIDGREHAVVGVVEDGKYRTLGESPLPFVYQSIDQSASISFRTAVVRFESEELASTLPVRDSIRRHGPHLAVTSLGSLSDAISTAFVLPELAGRLFGGLGALGLFLSATGLYGVLAYGVSHRTHEIGVRMAMGARAGSILGLVLRQGLRVTLAGVLLGLGLSLVVTRSLAVILYGISPTDLPTLTLVVVALCLAAALACWVPARRALAVDPLAALRHD